VKNYAGMTSIIISQKAYNELKRKLFLIFSGVVWLNLCGFSQTALDLFPEHPGSLVCWSEALVKPRILKVFCVKQADPAS
jgi:hypothetical protein